jgi:manganese efflux pump family protein
MSLFSLFLLALALAADSFAASLVTAGQGDRPALRQAVQVGALFAGVQTLMPLIGWRAGLELQPLIAVVDHWIAFTILAAIGAKMIFEALHDGETLRRRHAFAISALILTAIATSIDALVVGFGFGFLNIPVLIALAMIGSVTFAVSVAGVYLGHRVGAHFGEYVEIISGLVLIAIGFRILFIHLFP